MSYDYCHGVYAADQKAAKNAEAIADGLAGVLRTYGLVDELPGRWCLDRENTGALQPDRPSAPRARNVGLSGPRRFDPSRHDACVEYIFGRAEVHPDENWAAAEFSIVAGADYRLAPAGEMAEITVTNPPMVDGAELVSFEPETPKPSDPNWDSIAFGAPAFDASTDCSAPSCEFVALQPPAPGAMEAERGDDFTGLWRVALFTHTTAPWMVWEQDEQLGLVLPETDFKRDLWAALGGAAYEFGFPW